MEAKLYTTIKVEYGRAVITKYSYLCDRKLADQLKPGDLVVVPARDFWSVARVTDVDAEPDIPKMITLKWVAAKFTPPEV